MRLHVIGASGYGAGELLRYLHAHPTIRIGELESGSSVGEVVGTIFPDLRRLPIGTRTFAARGTVLATLAACENTNDDVVVLAGSHELARDIAPQILALGARVLDLSDAFRLDATQHGAVYGMPERYRKRIAEARLIANPGCFPTTTLLALIPLADSAAQIQSIVLDIKSGISGAGRTPKVGSMLTELEGEVRAYGLNGHRHIPEIAQELQALGIEAPFVFTPQVVPIARGMLGSIYVQFTTPPSHERIAAAYSTCYADSPGIRLLPPDTPPSLRAVARSNDAELSWTLYGATLRVLCGIDNLGKGAAGQAVQSLNLLARVPEETNLHDR